MRSQAELWHPCNPRTWEVEAGESGAAGPHGCQPPPNKRVCFTVQSGDFAGAVRAVVADFSSGE